MPGPMPLVPIASRLETFTKVDTSNCELVVMAGKKSIGSREKLDPTYVLRVKPPRPALGPGRR
jgi:hypothetical protein